MGVSVKGRRAGWRIEAGDETKRRPLKTIFRITVLPAGIVYGQPIRSNETQSVAENNRASTACRSHDVPSYFLSAISRLLVNLPSSPATLFRASLSFFPPLPWLPYPFGFIRSTSILRRVVHTDVSLVLLHSIPSPSSSLSAPLCPSSALPRPFLSPLSSATLSATLGRFRAFSDGPRYYMLANNRVVNNGASSGLERESALTNERKRDQSLGCSGPGPLATVLFLKVFEQRATG